MGNFEKPSLGWCRFIIVICGGSSRLTLTGRERKQFE